MGQNVNPRLYRINKTEEWDSKYIEKKLPELASITQNDLSIKNFVIKFFQDNNLIVNKVKVNHLIDSLQIFISYYKKTHVIPLPKIQKTRKKTIQRILNQEAISNLTRNRKASKLLRRKLRKSYLLKVKSLYPFKNHEFIRNKLKNKLNTLTPFKLQELTLRAQKKIVYERVKKKLWSCLDAIFNRIKTLKNKTKSIHLFFQNINHNLDLRKRKKGEEDTRTPRQKRQLNYVALLRRFQNERFFKEGLNIFSAADLNHNPAKLLNKYICAQMRRMTKHNNFMRFLRAGLIMFFSRRKDLKGLKIKIKGRFNKRPRAKHRIILLRKGVTLIKASSKVYYSEGTAFGPNGTSGIKIWLEKKRHADMAKKRPQTEKRAKKLLKNLKLLIKNQDSPKNVE